MNEIKISELKTDETISNLIPEMTEKEYLDLKSSIDENGLRHEIDISSDNTILDGRHRVRACESLGYVSIPFKRHDLDRQEAIKFVRDTAVERRNLTDAQRLNIILNSEDVIEEISGRAKKNQIESADIPNSRRLGSTEPNRKSPTNTNAELGKLAGLSGSTVKRAKKVKKENPEGYEKVVAGESTWTKEYNDLPTVKKPKPVKEVVDDVNPEVKRTKKKEPEDLRDVINNNAASGEELKLLRIESDARHLIELCKEVNELIEGVKEKGVFDRFVSTLEVEHIKKSKMALNKLIKNGGF